MARISAERLNGAGASPDADLLVVVYDGVIETGLFNPNARDDCHAPTIALRDEAARRGYRMVDATGPVSERAARILHWDAAIAARLLRERASLRGRAGALWRKLRHREPAWYPYASLPADDERVALILIEPPVVSPANYRPELLAGFRTVLTWNDDLVDGVKFFKYCFPIPEAPTLPEQLVPFEKKRLCVNISGNKLSAEPGELYAARRNTIRYLERRFPTQFDLFGIGWGGAATLSGERDGDYEPFRSYRGTVESKTETMKNYRFALCYENSDGPAGWVTEKIFDCLRADCVPIYLGAPNIADYVDEDAFIDRRRFTDDEALADFLERMEKDDWVRYREAALRYLESDRLKQFLPDAFAQSVLAALRIGATDDAEDRGGRG